VKAVKNINNYITAAILSLLLISLVVAYMVQHQPEEGFMQVEIYKNGKLYRRIPLLDKTIEEVRIADSESHYNIVEIKGGRVRVKEADCPNQFCVKTGWLSRPGQIAFCAPNRLKIVISGRSNGVDTITY
jgi:hypothetical protein